MCKNYEEPVVAGPVEGGLDGDWPEYSRIQTYVYLETSSPKSDTTKRNAETR